MMGGRGGDELLLQWRPEPVLRTQGEGTGVGLYEGGRSEEGWGMRDQEGEWRGSMERFRRIEEAGGEESANDAMQTFRDWSEEMQLHQQKSNTMVESNSSMMMFVQRGRARERELQQGKAHQMRQADKLHNESRGAERERKTERGKREEDLGARCMQSSLLFFQGRNPFYAITQQSEREREQREEEERKRKRESERKHAETQTHEPQKVAIYTQTHEAQKMTSYTLNLGRSSREESTQGEDRTGSIPRMRCAKSTTGYKLLPSLLSGEKKKREEKEAQFVEAIQDALRAVVKAKEEAAQERRRAAAKEEEVAHMR
eukprot:2107676-Rhodomonas_salina.1